MASENLQLSSYLLSAIAYILNPTRPIPLRIKDKVATQKEKDQNSIKDKLHEASRVIKAAENGENLYTILGVDPSKIEKDEDIDKAYHLKSRLLHPDKAEEIATDEQKQILKHAQTVLNGTVQKISAYESHPLRQLIFTEQGRLMDNPISMQNVFTQMAKGNLNSAFAMYSMLGKQITDGGFAFKQAVLNIYDGKNAQEIEDAYKYDEQDLLPLVREAIGSTKKSPAPPTAQTRSLLSVFIDFLDKLFFRAKPEPKAAAPEIIVEPKPAPIVVTAQIISARAMQGKAPVRAKTPEKQTAVVRALVAPTPRVAEVLLVAKSSIPPAVQLMVVEMAIKTLSVFFITAMSSVFKQPPTEQPQQQLKAANTPCATVALLPAPPAAQSSSPIAVAA